MSASCAGCAQRIVARSHARKRKYIKTGLRTRTASTRDQRLPAQIELLEEQQACQAADHDSHEDGWRWGNNTTSHDVTLAALSGLSETDMKSSGTHVKFRIQHDAGERALPGERHRHRAARNGI